jgi:hypothetical protein
MTTATEPTPYSPATHGASPPEPSPMPSPPTAQQAHADYHQLLGRLIDAAPLVGYSSVLSLPELTDHDLRTVLHQRPELFWEAIADSATVGRLVTHFLGAPRARDRYALVGVSVINIVWDYAKPLLLIDVQEEMERRQTMVDSTDDIPY